MMLGAFFGEQSSFTDHATPPNCRTATMSSFPLLSITSKAGKSFRSRDTLLGFSNRFSCRRTSCCSWSVERTHRTCILLIWGLISRYRGGRCADATLQSLNVPTHVHQHDEVANECMGAGRQLGCRHGAGSGGHRDEERASMRLLGLERHTIYCTPWLTTGNSYEHTH
jgi:hypothetical protein